MKGDICINFSNDEITDNDGDTVVLVKEKHHKGYMFDSLVYRFKDYQAKTFLAEVCDYKYENKVTEVEARAAIKRRHTRDLRRFIEILDEVVGEHD